MLLKIESLEAFFASNELMKSRMLSVQMCYVYGYRKICYRKGIARIQQSQKMQIHFGMYIFLLSLMDDLDCF